MFSILFSECFVSICICLFVFVCFPCYLLPYLVVFFLRVNTFFFLITLFYSSCPIFTEIGLFCVDGMYVSYISYVSYVSCVYFLSIHLYLCLIRIRFPCYLLPYWLVLFEGWIPVIFDHPWFFTAIVSCRFLFFLFVVVVYNIHLLLCLLKTNQYM